MPNKSKQPLEKKPNKEKNHSYNSNLMLMHLMQLLFIFVTLFVIMHSITPAYAAPVESPVRSLGESIYDNMRQGAFFDFDKFPQNKTYDEECMKRVPEDFSYQMASEYVYPFKKLGAICRITGKYYCDENEISLTPIEKDMMKIYNREGKNGNYIPILKKVWGDFYEYLCTVRPYSKRFYDKRGGVCLRNLQLLWMNQTESCPNREEIIYELTLTYVQRMRDSIPQF